MMTQPNSTYWYATALEYGNLAESTNDTEARQAFLTLSKNCTALAWRLERMAAYECAHHR